MANFSSDLTVMKDSIVKISDKIIRDFTELENLQNSQKSCEQFSEKLVEYIQDKLMEYFKTKKPLNDVVFLDKNNNLGESTLSARYVISPIYGIINLIHAIPYFSVCIALQRKDKDGNFKTMCGLVDNPITNETFLVEEGKGAYVNSRRLRISSRSKLSDAMVAIQNSNDKNFICNCVKKYDNLVITNCEILNLCNTASGKFDVTILNKGLNPIQELGLLFVQEAGGLVKKLENGETVICNEQLYSQF